VSVPTTASLLKHPADAVAAPADIEITAACPVDGGLILCYRVTGTDIRLPSPQPPGPADGLWQNTCCEAFVTDEGGGYHEFNFSPSGQWAAYRFTDYRERDYSHLATTVPQFIFTPLPDGFALQATLPAALLPPGNALHIGLTAVLEATDGSKSHWALTHCAAQPDFHLRQSFTLTLNRPAT
jgi:hypothetical protein